ncbi:MAG: KH domain-containing protein [Cryomorphaceae bacterium]|jgi:uncharacterized protein|nr:KH domain-containing protein [Cryomorphaceae bacterium]
MGEMTNVLKEYIEFTVRLVVDNPEDVRVQLTLSTKTVIAQIYVNKIDIGKVIGRKGRIIEALKVLCLSIKNTKYSDDTRKILLEVIEDEDSNFSFK